MEDLIAFYREQLHRVEYNARLDRHYPSQGNGIYACPAIRPPREGEGPFTEDDCECGMTERQKETAADLAVKRSLIDYLSSMNGPREHDQREILIRLVQPYADLRLSGFRDEWRLPGHP